MRERASLVEVELEIQERYKDPAGRKQTTSKGHTAEDRKGAFCDIRQKFRRRQALGIRESDPHDLLTWYRVDDG